jgi:hypothetical protein
MSNYNGRQPNNTAYIKTFVNGLPINLWKVTSYSKTDGSIKRAITPISTNANSLYIPGDLFVDGTIYNPSDINLKKDINLIQVDDTNKLMNLKPSSFILKNDSTNHVHYGFIAQDFENEYPELVENKPNKTHNNLKSINYLEIIPLLVNKIQLMQTEINELKEKVNSIVKETNE